MKDIIHRTWKVAKSTFWVYIVIVTFLVLLGHNPLIFGGFFILVTIYIMAKVMRRLFATLRQ